MTRRSKLSVILTGLSIVGVGLTGFLSAKCSEDYICARDELAGDRWNEMDDLEFYKHKDEKYHSVLSKSDELCVFLKGYAPALIAGVTTCGCIFGAEKLNLTDIAILGTALAGIKYKYEDAMRYLKIHSPELYSEVRQFVNHEAAMRKWNNDVEGKFDEYRLEDGRIRCYITFLDQIVYIFPKDVLKIQWFITSKLGTKGVCTVNEVADYICQDLRCKDVHIIRDDKYWELVPYGDREVTEDDFPILLPGEENILDDEGVVESPCVVMEPSIEPLSIKQMKNHYI